MEWLTGAKMADMARGAASLLESEKERIDALNVFPVPDGDTGANMSLTVRSAIERLGERAAHSSDDDFSGVLSRLAEGALLGARGNSGTILSQYFQGLYEGAMGRPVAGPSELAHCLQKAFEAACLAVETPEEGTILTVARAAAEAAMESASQGADVIEVWETALERARLALEATPTMLPVLQEAGVVDAGGEGLVVMMEGALRALRGEVHFHEIGFRPQNGTALPEAALPTGGDHVRGEQVHDPHNHRPIKASEIQYGYCTEFLIRGKELSKEVIRARLASLGDSLLVVGHESLVKVHLHTNNPGLALEVGCELGQISSVSVGNMWEQNEAASSSSDAAAPAPGPAPKSVPAGEVGVLAVVWGEGFREILESQGVTALFLEDGGAKPSTGEILAAIENMPQERVILLPNSKDVLLSAQQAAKITSKDVRILPTSSEAEAVAAAVCIIPDAPVDAIFAEMQATVQELKVASLTQAVRDASVGGVPVQEGAYIGLSSGQVLASGFELSSVLVELVEKLAPEPGQLVTLFHGAGVDPSAVEGHVEALLSRWDGVEFESYYGGQPIYHYVLSVE